MTWQEKAAAYLTRQEGKTDWLYLDVTSLITIGVGCMIPNIIEAQKLNMIWPASGNVAKPDQIASEFSYIVSVGQTATAKTDPRTARAASYYKPLCELRMPDAEIDRLLLLKIDQFAVSLSQRFPDFADFPTNPKIGCTAMCYALGPAGMIHEYPKFCAAVDAQAWKTAAEECHLGLVGDAENEALKQLFLSAVM